MWSELFLPNTWDIILDLSLPTSFYFYKTSALGFKNFNHCQWLWIAAF